MKQNKGFTLIEVIITLAILSIVTVMAFSFFSTGLKVWEKGEDKSDVVQNVRHAIELISMDVRRADKIISADKIDDIGTHPNFGFIIMQQGESTDTYKYILYYYKNGKIKRAVVTKAGPDYPDGGDFSGHNEVAQFITGIDGKILKDNLIEIRLDVKGNKTEESTYKHQMYIRCPTDF